MKMVLHANKDPISQQAFNKASFALNTYIDKVGVGETYNASHELIMISAYSKVL